MFIQDNLRLRAELESLLMYRQEMPEMGVKIEVHSRGATPVECSSRSMASPLAESLPNLVRDDVRRL
jgi:hypothetical protein